MKRVLIIAADGLTKSGVPNVFMSIIKELSSIGYSFDVLYFDEENAFYKKDIELCGGKAIYCSIDKTRSSRIKKLYVKAKYKHLFREFLKENGPYDCVHSFKGFESGYFLKVAKSFGVPVRIAHMTFLYRRSSNLIVNAIENRERRLTEKYATLIISDSFRTSNNNLPRSKKSIVIRNSVDEKTFPFNELDNDITPISMVQIGSYCDNKNQLFSLSVLKNIISFYPNSILHFVGFRNPDDFDYLDTLKTTIIQEKLKKNVIFHKFDADIKSIFKKSHYLLFPSRFESFGIVPVEAQMSGLSCYCSNTISTENNCGGCKYIALSNAESWGKEIINDYKKTLGTHKKFDCSEFSKKTMIDKYKKIYGES